MSDESLENIIENVNDLVILCVSLLFFFLQEPSLDNLQRIAHRLAKRALENGHDPNFYSPFARSAKRSLGINIIVLKHNQLNLYAVFIQDIQLNSLAHL